MMALQKGILAASRGAPPEECDVSGLILGFELLADPNGSLVVLNPPTFAVQNEDEPPETSVKN